MADEITMKVSESEKALLETLRAERNVKDAKRIEGETVDLDDIKPGMSPAKRAALKATLRKLMV